MTSRGNHPSLTEVEHPMQQSMKYALALLTLTFASLVGLQPCPEGPSKAEMFALELTACNEAAAAGKPDKCKLFGKIKAVESFPDVKVEVVSSFPDIKVQLMSSFADEPGEWTMVDSFPDYKVQFVDSFPDYKIKYVNSFPGCD